MTTEGNREEAVFREWATSEGWSVTKRGWPDFICRRGPAVMCVEVKDSDDLSSSQRATAGDLAAHGIPVYVWRAPRATRPGRTLEPVTAPVPPLSGDDLTDSLRARVADLEGRVGSLSWRLESLRRRRAQEWAESDAAAKRLTDDLGYLLRRAESGSRNLDGTYGYMPVRLNVLLRRYRDLLMGQPPEADPDAGSVGSVVRENGPAAAASYG